ncbi:MAG: heterocyst development glycosyltransferase HepC [Rivularia sp. (in: cyanobacteria)]
MVIEQKPTSVSFASYPNSEKPIKEKAFTDNNYCNDDLGYKIKLKGEKLLVKLTRKPSHMHLLSNRSEAFLGDWLQFSPATIVQIDSGIELDKLKMWANQCKRLKKTAFLRLSKKEKCDRNPNKNSNNLNRLNWVIKRCLNIFGALILIVILAPVFIALALLIKIYFHQPILKTQWCIGKQGKLFCIYQFGANLRELNLNSLSKLPQLFNVLKGEMSFVGRFPWSLAEVKKMSLSEQQLVNVSPGIAASITDKK